MHADARQEGCSTIAGGKGVEQPSSERTIGSEKRRTREVPRPIIHADRILSLHSRASRAATGTIEGTADQRWRALVPQNAACSSTVAVVNSAVQTVQVP